MRPKGLCLAVFALCGCGLARAETAAAMPAQIRTLQITILSTPLSGPAIGEWGFSALVVADGHRILFDTGQHPDTVLRNAKQLKIDLTTVPEVVLSHNHWDHVGGLTALRQSVLSQAPSALARVHVGQGIFTPRTTFSKGIDVNPMTLIRGEYEKTGGMFIVHDHPVELYPGVWLTGPVPRNYEPCGGEMPGAALPPGYDTIPEDMALVCNTSRGLVVLMGCGHAGVVNVLAYAQSFIRPAPIHALIGGFHLTDATEATLAWTTAGLRPYRIENILGAHCTGFENIARLRRDLGLDPTRAFVGGVRSGFELGKGIEPNFSSF
jgi:7,8-dihydropterin-6-yl-methyl-4-(beta-D-ribofuranosyl)aminobenzene 5'-phosphate synthase